MYGLTRDQYNRQHADWRKTGYQVNGDYNSIATKLQDECEAEDQVLYPIHIESDELQRVGPKVLTDWFREFVEDHLEVPFRSCTQYFSGSRSIHIHVPRFVSGERQRERLKQQAEKFCEDTGAKLDCCIYGRKRLFRLPGVEHEKTGVPKVEFDGEWDDSQMCKLYQKATPDVPESYEAVLRHVFVKDSLTIGTVSQAAYTPQDLFQVLDSDKTILEFGCDKKSIETPLIELQEPPNEASTSEMKQWLMCNAKEFSPYALADGNFRSVAALKIKGTPFARKEVTAGNSSRPVHALIPAYFYGAQGCAGEKFTKADEHAPLQLSKGKGKDYDKWTSSKFVPGDNIVIIGGKSRSSKIHSVKSYQAIAVGNILTGENGSRDKALEYLENEGFDIGSAGRTEPRSLTRELAKSRGYSESGPRSMELTKAQKFKQQAERDGIQSLSPEERFQVACRLLLRGWQPAWDWFKEQFGSEFKPDVTRTYFTSIVNRWPEYDHVQIPTI
ncbi:hypothetical protein EA462_02430 [Natrarchaeobius halalkaliphilus]|uniref:DNA primase n=1 Tax=Natrarchaeobius halalkaliphilus TaxID=1679091 RepID=A0A3N6P5D1_9EURY|nr:hypothetical protein EA462_02430 [Natrarchaeobius halalkaliphilus]